MPQQREEEKEEDTTLGDILSGLGWFAAKVFGVAVVTIELASVVLPLLGFGQDGVRANSMASSYQSRTFGGNIPAGSTFSSFQRMGVNGLSSAAKQNVVYGAAAAVGACHLLRK